MAQNPQEDDDVLAGPSNATSRAAEGQAEASTKRPSKRKVETQKAIDKIKDSKRFQKRKKHLQDSDDEDDLIEELLKSSGPAPGQMANCENCNVRFTVTPYSRAGPDGGLLCNPCGKELDREQGPVKKKKVASGGPVGRRRKTQSNLLDGNIALGAKSLMSLCIETLAKNIHLAHDLGTLPPKTIDKVARILSKKRLLDPNTLELFLQPDAEEVAVYDGAKLSPEDIIRIFQLSPKIKSLKIRNAVQFKDEVMDYLLSRDQINLEGLYMYGANLLSSEMWIRYLVAKGKTLRRLHVYYTDKHFGDECLATLKDTTPSLMRLKIHNNQKVSSAGIQELAHLKNLQHLSVHVHNRIHSNVWVDVLNNIGTGLKTVSLRMTPQLNNTVLKAIHDNCRVLKKLRITDSETMTDAGFSRLFTDWTNTGLVYVDLQKCRHVDAQHPRENPDGIGFCSEGFKALMKHSGQTLQYLNTHACRHISKEAFEDVFNLEKVYPNLKSLEISFCEEVNDFIVGSIFKACPSLKELNVFGCMKVKDVKVPRGKILVGVPNALGMVIEGAD